MTRPRWWLPAGIVLCGVLAYSTSFGGVFLFDDYHTIVLSEHIDAPLWPPGVAMGPSLRPVLFYTFAVDYAVSGLETWSYHLTSLLIHLAAALALFGVLRRSFAFARAGAVRGPRADYLAAAVAALWVAHPLTTQSVTYITQRGESLAGLFYLLTLYCAVRSMQSERPAPWYAGVFLSFIVGAACKEIVATAPLLVLLFDRSVVTGSFRRSLRARWPLYTLFVAAPVLVLVGRWLLDQPTLYMFVTLWARATGRDVMVAPDGARLIVPGDPDQVAALQYLASQPQVILHYLRLSLWPDPLVFDYGWPAVTSWRQAVGPGALVLSLLAATVWALRRRPAVGFVAAAFFIILAPTSSFVPLPDLAVEHRMYLPLAAVLVLATLALSRVLELIGRGNPQIGARVTVGLLLVVVSGLIVLTSRRNLDYHSGVAMWRDVTEHRPGNPRGHYNYGTELLQLGRYEDAIVAFERAIELEPEHAWAYTSIGAALEELGRVAEARRYYVEALAIDPRLASAHNNLGKVLADEGQLDAAMDHFLQAERYSDRYTDLAQLRRPLRAHLYNNMGSVRMRQGRPGEARTYFQQALLELPTFAPVHNNMGLLEAGAGRWNEAIAHYQEALAHDPDLAEAHANLGGALLALGRGPAAVSAYRAAALQAPDNAAFHNDLGVALAGAGDQEAARRHYREAIRLDPTYARAYNNLGLAWAAEGRHDEAVAALRSAVAIDPGYAEAYDNLATSLSASGHVSGALEAYRAALRADPAFARAHNNLGVLLANSGRAREAVEHFRAALRLDPDYADARANLERVLARAGGES